MSAVQYLIGDVRERLASLPAGSVDLVVTSWPYWLQRSYLPTDHPDKHLEIGQEPTVAGYIATLLDITAELGRVLAPHGSIALELADTFSGSGGAGGDYDAGGFRDGQPRWRGSGKTPNRDGIPEDHRHTLGKMHTTGDTAPLLDHWWEDDPRLDRFDQEAWLLSTHPYKGAHFATFSPKLITPLILAMCPEKVCTECGEPSRRIVRRESSGLNTRKHRAHVEDARQVGAVSSSDVPDASTIEHAGWSDCGHDSWRRGVTLDPFGGSGTTGMVASGVGRDAILIDLDDRNLDLARERIGMFLEVAS